MPLKNDFFKIKKKILWICNLYVQGWQNIKTNKGNIECLEKNSKHGRINIVMLLCEQYVYVGVYYSACSSDPPSWIGRYEKSIKSSKDDNRFEMASVKTTIK